MGGRGKGKVGFVKPPEPSFLRKLKEQHGYKEGPSLEDKMRRDGVDLDEDGEEDKDGERPVVVVLKDGDLTQEEADKIIDKQKKEDEEEKPPPDGRIMFKKPTKKRDLDSKTEDSDQSDQVKVKKKKKDKKKDKQLLSFDEEEEEL